MFKREKTPGQEKTPGRFLLWMAAILLLALAGAQGYVSFRAQYSFIYAAKREHWPSMLEAVGLDTGAVIFALLGLAQARIGRPAWIERALNLACAFGSMAMNLLGADLASPRSVAVYVLPALLYAAGSDRLIATAGVAAGVPQRSVWGWAGSMALYFLRACVAFPSTARGLRQRVLDATPLPALDAPGPEVASAPGLGSGVLVPGPARGGTPELPPAPGNQNPDDGQNQNQAVTPEPEPAGVPEPEPATVPEPEPAAAQATGTRTARGSGGRDSRSEAELLGLARAAYREISGSRDIGAPRQAEVAKRISKSKQWVGTHWDQIKASEDAGDDQEEVAAR